MSLLTEVLIAGRRWLVAGLSPSERDAILGPDGLRLPQWIAEGRAEVVKHAPHRTVYRVKVAGLDLHVKHDRGDLREWCRQQMRGSRSRREFTLTREVAARGVPTLEMLVCGESIRRRGPSDSWVVSRTLPEVESLLDFLLDRLPTVPAGERVGVLHRLANALGACLARIHRAGVRHEDLHPGNLLVRSPQGEPELFLIDLPYARVGKPLDWQATRDNLVMLDRWFALRFSASDRRLAWRAYCATRADLALDEHELARDLGALTASTLLTHIGGLDHRCLGGNRHFRRVRARGVRGYAVAELAPADLAPLLADSDVLFDRPGAVVLKKSKSSAVVVVNLPVGGRVRPVIAKRIDANGTDPLASLFRTPGALRSWSLGHALRFRGLPTPRPLAVWHRQALGMKGSGYLLMDLVPEAVSLHVCLKTLAELPPRERRRRLDRILAELARLVRTLHAFRYSHRDLKADNLLVSPQGSILAARELREIPSDERDRIWLIDLVGLKKCANLSRDRKMRDLARLHASFRDDPSLSRSDRLRFLTLYLRHGLGDEAGWKVWWKRVDRIAREKIARNRRRGRVVG